MDNTKENMRLARKDTEERFLRETRWIESEEENEETINSSDMFDDFDNFFTNLLLESKNLSQNMNQQTFNFAIKDFGDNSKKRQKE